MAQASLTYEDLQRFPDDGLRREIIGGQLFVTPAPDFSHQDAVAAILVAFYHYAEQFGGHAIVAPFDVYFDERDVVEPDVIYVGRERLAVLEERFSRGAPSIVVEVLSRSTQRRDRTFKLELYAERGVPEYWIVNRKKRTVERHTNPQGGTYRDVTTFDRDYVESLVASGLRVAFDKIFRTSDPR